MVLNGVSAELYTKCNEDYVRLAYETTRNLNAIRDSLANFQDGFSSLLARNEMLRKQNAELSLKLALRDIEQRGDIIE